MRPFLKWAGSKYRIVDRVNAVLPEGKRLIEPFLGSGAVFLNTDYSRYVLAERNPDLINLYKLLKGDGEEFIKYCRKLFTAKNNSEERYYYLRDQFNKTQDTARRSALFVYMNRHGFNGLCRYNRSGGFNVPFGRYTKPYFPEKEMHFFHEKAQRATFCNADFVMTLRKAKQGDVVYCDPPYAPLTKTANFTQYSQFSFGDAEQEQLADEAKKLAKRGVPVIISNHNTAFIKRTYQEAKLHAFKVQRNISRNGAGRIKVPEVLAVFS